MYILKILIFQTLLFLSFSEPNHNPFPRTGPQELLITLHDCEEFEQKTLQNYAINQVKQCETEPQAIETTNNIEALYSKARATTLTGYKFTATFSAEKIHKNRQDHESFYQSNIERLLHLSPQDCKNDLRLQKLTQNDGMNKKLVNFQVLPDLALQAELEKHQGHIRIDRNFPFYGTHGRST